MAMHDARARMLMHAAATGDRSHRHDLDKPHASDDDDVANARGNELDEHHARADRDAL